MKKRYCLTLVLVIVPIFISTTACIRHLPAQFNGIRSTPSASQSWGTAVAETGQADRSDHDVDVRQDIQCSLGDRCDCIVFQAGANPTESFYGIHETTLDEAWDGGVSYVQMGGEYHVDVLADDNEVALQEHRRILMRFDIEQGFLPPGIRVIKAHLELFHYDTHHPNPTAEQVVVHLMTAPWDEGTGRESPPPGYYVDGATWLLRLPDVFWATPGGDFDPEPIASTIVSPDVWDWESWDLTNAVREWLAGEPNYGIMLRVRGPAWYSFLSSEFEDDPELRPRLVLSTRPAP